MATNFNVNPYYDDFNEDKKFHRVLFRPGFAVQARELTQIQSILQNQIKRFGDHVFKDGAQVIPGQIQHIRTYDYARLTTFSTASVTDLIGTIFTGDSNGVQAEVINATAATDDDDATIYLRYLKASTDGTITRFNYGESLTGDGGETATIGTDGVSKPIDTKPTGLGSAVRIEEGIYYIDGFFVKNSAETLILEKYYTVSNFKVGFTVTESLITPSDDASLNDNAQGTSNENAPGAHRYKIDLTLTKKTLTDEDDDDFVQLLRIVNGNVESKVVTTDYSLLADTLARRTFDESGDYTVRKFDIDVREFYFEDEDPKYGRGIFRPDTTQNGTVANPIYGALYTADQAKARLAIGMGAGKAYVQGYELETVATKYVDVDKARDFDTENNSTTTTFVGNFVDVTNIYGSPDIDTVSGETEAYKQVTLYKEATSSRGSANSGAGTDIHTIGIAHPRFFEYDSGTVGASSSNTTSQYKLGLFNITAFAHLRTTLAHSLTTGETVTGGTSGATGIVEASSATVSAAISNMVGTSSTLTVTTSSSHNLSTGQRVTFDSVGGMTEVNGNTYEITVTSSTEFTISVDASGFSSYTSGGTAQNGIVVISNLKGTFVAGETITGATSTNTAVIDSDTDYFKSIVEYDFKDAKQIYQPGSPAFTADTVLTSDSTDPFDESQLTLTGTISIANSSAAVIGKNTSFTTELKVGDVIVFTDDTGEQLTGTVLAITSNTSLTLASAVGAADVTTSSPLERRRTKLQETEDNTLVYKLPESTIKTLKTATNDGITDTTFTVRRQFVTTLSGDGIGIFTARANESFISLESGDFTLMHMTAGSSAGSVGDITTLSGNNHEGDPIFVRSSDNQQLTIDLGANYDGSKVKLIASVTRQVAGEKSKTLVSGSTVNVTTQATAQASSISLGKADIYQLNSVYMAADFSTAATTSDTDITDRFELDNGQRDNFYDIGRIKLKSGAQLPTGRLLINFDYFTHGAGDYFSVDSYTGVIDYEDIPSFFSSTREETLQLRDCVDFRPRVADASDVIGYNDKDATGAKSFVGTGSVPVNIPKRGNDFRSDFEFYLSRIDAIYLTATGEFKQSRGEPAIDPQRPEKLDDSMLLCYLRLPAYTFNTADVDITEIDNRRYTMRDIGKLESRIRNLEYYTSLSLLEQEALNTEIQDADGNDRFKNGFVVDSFKGHNVGDTTNIDYSVAMDLENGLVRPLCSSNQIELDEIATTDAARASVGYQKTGDLITLPYNEVTLVENTAATKGVNVSPFDVFGYVGSMRLYPDIDEWKETKQRPDLVVNNNLLYNSIKDVADETITFGTTWNEWQNNWTGTFQEKDIQGNKTTIKKGKTGVATKTGVKKELASSVVKQSFGEKLVDVSFVPYIRGREVRFVVTGLMPNRVHYPFFEEVDVSRFCKPISQSLLQTGKYRITPFSATIASGNFGDELKSDANGTIQGIFRIPDPKGPVPECGVGLSQVRPRWRTGERTFKLIDDNNYNVPNSNHYESFATAKYRAQGLQLTEQETIYATKTPEIISHTLLQEKDIKKVTSSEVKYKQPSYSDSNNGNNNGNNNNDPGHNNQPKPPSNDNSCNFGDPTGGGGPSLPDLPINLPPVNTPPSNNNGYQGSIGGGGGGNSLGCFIEGTLITMDDGTQKPVEQVDIGDVVAVGGFVFATGKFLIDNLYEYKGIKVSGSHMVQEDGQWTRVADSKHAVSLGDDEHIVYVFGSENRRILINDILFTDYFELTEQEQLIKNGDDYFENWKEFSKDVHEQNVNELNH